MRMVNRSVGLAHIQGQPQPRRCQCDRPAPIADTERDPLGLKPASRDEPETRCAKCGHRTRTE